jgi:hypothetical protein
LPFDDDVSAICVTSKKTAKKTAGKTREPGRGKSQASMTLINAAHNILAAIQPAPVRAVCYRLFIDGLIRDMGKNSTGKVSKQLVWARENNMIPWHWIVDEHRRVERATMWDNTGEIVDACVASYRRDNWREQPVWIQVWSEKGTVRGSLKPILDRYGVGFQVAHGYQGASIMHDIAEQSGSSAVPLTIIYVGDFDPSGMHMSEVDIPSRLARYNGIATVKRVALTASDLAGLPGFPATDKKKDSRYSWFTERYGQKCVELDALSPAILRDRVEAAIIELMDMDAWNRSLMVEKAEIGALNHYHDSWKRSISSLAAKYSDTGMETAP